MESYVVGFTWPGTVLGLDAASVGVIHTTGSPKENKQMLRQPFQLRLDLTLPDESVDKLSQFLTDCIARTQLKLPQMTVGPKPVEPGQHKDEKPKRLRPHQSPLDLELEEGVQLLVDTRQAAKLLKVSRELCLRCTPKS